MKVRSILAVALVAGAVLSVPCISGVAGRAPRKAVSTTWFVTSIDTGAVPKTITLALGNSKKETKTMEFAAATEIIVNGVAGKLEDVKVGMKAEVQLAEAPGFVLAQLKLMNANAPAEANPERPKKEKKAKNKKQ